MTTKASSHDAYDQTVLLSPPPARTSAERVRGIDDPLIGTMLGEDYRIESVIGEGGMGRLYEAEHVRMGRRVAIKVIHHQIAQREDMRLRFEREARVMGRVQSDHVVTVLDVVAANDGRTCIVTELLLGSNLDDYLADHGHKLAVGEVVALARQCLRGLAAAHACGVVHRDLKPSNLFLADDSSGEASLKILDFGVAKLGGDADMTTTGTIVGTPAYMAPEQARGARLADARSDLYAVGAVMYRALTGRSPYDGSDSHGTLIRLMEEAPERPTLLEKTIPPGLEAVIEKAMARDPDERFQTAQEFIRALEPFQAAEHLHARVRRLSEGPGDPKTLGRIAQLSRPLAVLLLASVSIAAGSAVAAALALLVDSVSESPLLSASEVVLITIAAGIATAASAVGLSRVLGGAWRNVAMVQAFSARLVQALAVGAGTLGLLDLAAELWAAVVLLKPSANAPSWAAARVLVAMATGTTMIVRTRKKKR
jgi:serine/threonine-protein kinase